jgi:hypothetical protein
MAAPLLMGTIGKLVSSQGLGAAGLGELLGSQTQYLKDAIPSGLANALGIGNLLRGGAEPSRFETAGEHEAEVSDRLASRVGREPVFPTRAPRRGGMLKWAWVPLLLFLFGLLIAQRTHRTPAAGGTDNYNPAEVQRGQGASMPNLGSLNLTPGGIGDNLAKAVSSGNPDQPFAMSAQSVDDAGNLTDSGRKQVQEVGSVLKAMPNLKVSVTAYGSSEEAGASQANAIKAGLLASGVSGDRVATSGQLGNGPPTVRAQQ